MKKRSKSNCPIAPTSFIENIKQLCGNKAVFFLLDTMRALKSDIYKLKVPGISGGGFYIIGNSEATRQILLDETTEKPTEVYKSFNNIAGDKSMFAAATKDPYWYHVRKGTAPAFSSSEVKRMVYICEKNLDTWIRDELKPLMDSKDTFDPYTEMTYLTFKIILESAFEYRNASRQEYEFLRYNLEKCLKEFTFKEMTNPLRSLFTMWIPERRKAFEMSGELQAFAANLLEKYRNNPNKSVNNTVIRLIENNPSLSEKSKIAEILVFFIAGFDTTGSQLASALVLLAKYPEEAEKLKEDLLSSGMSEDKAPATRSKYLKSVIQECTRIMPVGASGSIRVTGKEFTFKNGTVTVPKNSIIWTPFLLMFRNEEYFDKPDEFRPGRWMDADKEMMQALVPFSLGKRNCIGQRLADAELYCCLAMLFSKYKFELVVEGTPVYFMNLKYIGAKLRPSRIDLE